MIFLVNIFWLERKSPKLAHYSKQACSDRYHGCCGFSPEEIRRMKGIIERGEIPFAEIITIIRNTEGEDIASVTTVWQVKGWSQVPTPVGL